MNYFDIKSTCNNVTILFKGQSLFEDSQLRECDVMDDNILTGAEYDSLVLYARPNKEQSFLVSNKLQGQAMESAASALTSQKELSRAANSLNDEFELGKLKEFLKKEEIKTQYESIEGSIRA